MRPPTEAEFEPVHFGMDYYDGLLRGYANFHGSPCYFKAAWDYENGERGDRYMVWGVSEQAFKLAEEERVIWMRWYVASMSGETSRETFPALPLDRERYELLRTNLQELLEKEMKQPPLICKADFRTRHGVPTRGDFQHLEVKWETCNDLSRKDSL